MTCSKQRGSVIFSIVFLILIIAVFIGLNALHCSSKWKLSGLKSDYGPIQGCLVQLPDGRWLPDERLREIDIKGN